MTLPIANSTFPCRPGLERDLPPDAGVYLRTMSPIVSALGEPLAFAAVSSVAATLAEWPISLFYLAADMHGWMKRSRIWPNSYASPELIAATVPSVAGRIYSIIIDQTLSFFFPYYVFKFSYGLDLLSEPPSLSFFVIRFILLHIAVDFIFYWMHRAFHESEFLWQVHKQHHQYNVPNALAHFWFSKAELAIQRFFKDWPLMVLFKLHFAEWLAWQVLNQILDVQIHSGYDHGYFWFGGWLGSRVDWWVSSTAAM